MKVAINGLGRIGRLALKIGLEKGINIVAVNDITDIENLAYLIKHDSVYGNYDKKVEAGKDYLKIGDKKIKVFSEKAPEELPWEKLNVDVVIECTGVFTKREDSKKHLDAGAKRVLISAPGKDSDFTIVLGVNDKKLKKSHKIISMASCTTNCLAPLTKVLDDEFGIKKGFLTTAHGYTASQGLVDKPSKKIRRGRAAAINIVPTTTGATTAVIETLPKLQGKLDGLAMRVPVASGSVVDFVAELKKSTSKEKINKAMKKAASKEMKGVLKYSEEELVSSDIIGESHSCIIDGLLTMCMGNMVKVLGWYDNEYAYSYRLIDTVKLLGKLR